MYFTQIDREKYKDRLYIYLDIYLHTHLVEPSFKWPGELAGQERGMRERQYKQAAVLLMKARTLCSGWPSSTVILCSIAYFRKYKNSHGRLSVNFRESDPSLVIYQESRKFLHYHYGGRITTPLQACNYWQFAGR